MELFRSVYKELHADRETGCMLPQRARAFEAAGKPHMTVRFQQRTGRIWNSRPPSKLLVSLSRSETL